MAKGRMSNILAAPKPCLGKEGGTMGPNRTSEKGADKGSNSQRRRLPKLSNQGKELR